MAVNKQTSRPSAETKETPPSDSPLSDNAAKVSGAVPPVAASAHFTKDAAQRQERERWVRRLKRKYHPYA